MFHSDAEHYVQVGIVHGSESDCGDANFPDIYSRLQDPEVFSFISKVCTLYIGKYFKNNNQYVTQGTF